MIVSLKQLCKSSNFYFSKTKAILKPLHSRLSCCLLSLIANDVFVPVRAHAWHRVTFYSYPLLTCSGGVLWVRGLTADNRVSAFHISCSSSLCQKFKKKTKKTVRWYLADSRLWGSAPGSTRAPAVSKGEERHDVSASISSRLAPSKAKVSDQISLYNRQDEKQQPQSDAACTLGHNGATYASHFQQWLRHFSMQWKQSGRA